MVCRAAWIVGAVLVAGGQARAETVRAEPRDDYAVLAEDLDAAAALGFTPAHQRPAPEAAGAPGPLDPAVLKAAMRASYRGLTGYVRADAMAHALAARGALAPVGDDASSELGATASVIGELAIPLCRLVGAQASGTVVTGADRTVTYDARAGACLPLPIVHPYVQLGRQRAVRVRPRELRLLPGERTDGWSLDAEGGMWGFAWQSYQFDFANLEAHYVEASDDLATATDFELAVDGFQLHRRGKGVRGGAQTTSFFQIRAHDVDVAAGLGADAPTASAVTIRVAGVDELQVAPRLYVSGGVGMHAARIGDGPSADDAHDATVAYDAALTTEVTVGRLPVLTRVHARSTIAPWTEGRVVNGHEVGLGATAWWQGDVMARLDLVAARVTIFDRTGARSRPAVTTGASGELTATVRGPLRVFAAVDVARQLAVDGEPALGVLATVGLAASVERGPDRAVLDSSP